MSGSISTIEDILPRLQEIANGEKTVFSANFDFISSDFVLVYLDEEKQTTGFTVDQTSNTVTFTTAPTSGTVVTIVRAIPVDWESETAKSALDRDALNRIYSLLVGKMQTIKEEVSRCMKTPIYSNKNGEQLSQFFLEQITHALDVLDNAEQVIDELEEKTADSVSQINSAASTGLSSIESAKTESLSSITTQTTSSLSQINSAASTGLSSIESAKTESLSSITTQTTSSLSQINSATQSGLAQMQEKVDAVNAVADEVSGAAAQVDAAVEEGLEDIETALGNALSQLNLGLYYTKEEANGTFMALSGNQTASGQKTFMSYITIKDNSNWENAPSTYTENVLIENRNASGKFVGTIRVGARANGEVVSLLYVKHPSYSSSSAYICITQKADGTSWANCPHPVDNTTATTSTNIVTVGAMNDASKKFNIVHRTGDETISGTKTFNVINIKDPASSYTNNGFIYQSKDKGNIAIGIRTAEANKLLSTLDFTPTGKIRFYMDDSVTERYIEGITPPNASDDSDKIPTTSWVNSRITSIMNSKTMPELTQLFLNTSGLDSGNVTLSQPFTNFPYFLIGLSNDTFTFITYQMFNSAIVDWFLKGNPVDRPFLFAAGGSSSSSPGVWQIKNYAHGSSTTLWVHDYNTTRVVCVYGVSF